MSAPTTAPAVNGVDFLRLMMLSREGDRREGILLRQSKGWFQVGGQGHEALAALAYLLGPEDWIFPYYRDRALMLARGLTNRELALAYFAKRESGSGGRQMPGHYSSRAHNVFSVCTPTGGGLLPACGAAWGMKLEGKSGVCLATIGDAASRQGEFFEAWAFALQERLPVVFLVEDNKYGISTPTGKFLPFHLGMLDPETYVKVDGRDPGAVLEAGRTAVEKARRGEGPSLLWVDLDRLSSHTSSDDHRVYRAAEDLEAMSSRDPIRLLAEDLRGQGLLDDALLDRLGQEVAAEVDRDYLEAERAADPAAAETPLHNFGTEIPAEAPPLAPGPRATMVSAINGVFKRILERDDKALFFGEDIEDPKGGVFGLTKGLSEAYPKQVFNSPLAEATIMGVAVGLAAYGWKPVFEIQFVDFLAPAWNQLTTNVSTLRWRTAGDWTCPMVLYAPYGAYLPGGSLWHSQSNESALAHVTGIKIAVPSTPEDAAGLFWSAYCGEDPAFILVPKHVFRKPSEVGDVPPVPFGKARLVQPGADVTLVAWGNCVELAQEAAAKSGVSCEILDLRSLVPLDRDAIRATLEKTGRAVVLSEDVRTAGFGQSVVAEIASDPTIFDLLLAPPLLVAREDVPIGYNPILEYAALPDVEDVLAAIRTVMG